MEALGWYDGALSPGQALAFDVAVHVGTLAAVVFYVRRDLFVAAAGCLELISGHVTPRGRLAINIAIGSFPIGIVGLLGKDAITHLLRSQDIVLAVIAATSIMFGLLLYLADRQPAKHTPRAESLLEISARGALVVGLAQVLALIPGASRAGVTMTAALFLGQDRPTAARFSFLLSIPAICGAGLLLGIDVAAAGDFEFGRAAIVAMITAFAAALASISLLMRWLTKAGFTPFVVYRLLLGVGLLFWVAM